jgi:hypothetical protein
LEKDDKDCRKESVTMKDVELLADLVAYLASSVRKAVAGLSRAELTWHPDAEGNSIGITVWHVSRWLDVLTMRVYEGRPASEEQWFTRGWAQKTGYDPRGIGYLGLGALTGYTWAEVVAVPFLGADDLLMYLDQVSEALRQQLLSLPEGALDRPAPGLQDGRTLYQRTRSILAGCFGHLGEIEALKAMQRRAKERGAR